MPLDLVNANFPASARAAASGGARSRGEGFASLVESEAPDATAKDKTDAPGESPLAGLLGVPTLSTAGATTSQAAGAAASDVPTVGAKGASTTLAAALQAQADALASAGDADARKTAAEQLAAEGVISVKGKTEIENVTLSVPGKNALDAPSKDAEGKSAGLDAAKAAGAGPAEAKPSDSKATADAQLTTGAEQPAAKPDADAGQDGEAGSERQAADQGQRAEAARSSAPADRIQTFQTSAAPATPSAQSGQAASGANPAAGAQVAAAVQVANQIASHAGSRRTRFEVQLDPGDLGRVDVRLDIGQDGRVATRLIVERPETLDLLRNDARELSRTLEQAGFQLGQGGLAFQLKDGRQPTWRADDAPSRSASADDDVEEIAPVAAAYARGPAAGSGGVDLKV